MGTKFSKHLSGPTPQTEPIPGREAEMVQNDAGGYGFKIPLMQQVRRFLILGTEGGTYYADERKHTLRACKALDEAVATKGLELLELIAAVSTGGLAPKNDYALFALATCFAKGSAEVKARAAEMLPRIARIGTHLFHFAEFVNGMRGWGRNLSGAVKGWYLNMQPKQLALQLLKYPSRDGWSHRDLLRLSHAKPKTAEQDYLFANTVGKEGKTSEPPELTDAIKWFDIGRKAMRGDFTTGEVITAIKAHRLPRECLNTKYLTEPDVWKALLLDMGMTAMVRNLGVMTANGTLKDLSNEVKLICERLESEEEVRDSKIHPIQLLMALLTYGSGGGARGGKTWKPVQRICDSLDTAFELSFGNVKPTGKRMMLSLDISGSMHGGEVAGCVNLTPAKAACAMAAIFLRTEKQVIVNGFGNSLVELPFRKRDSIDSMVRKIDGMNFGGTDASLPIRDAIDRKLDVDAFLCFTDGESWAGSEYPAQALTRYRKVKPDVDAKQVLIAFTATDSSLGDQSDPRVLDVVGFDASAPQLVQEFLAGEV